MNKINAIGAKMASANPRDRNEAYNEAWATYPSPTEMDPEERRILARARIIKPSYPAHKRASLHKRLS